MNYLRKSIAICSVFIFFTGILFPGKGYGITVKQEEEMGQEFMRVVLKHFELIEDPLIADYLNKVGNKIVAVLPKQPFTYHFYVIKEDVYNAFAAPAGHVFINSGLFAAMESEEELAGILAHEIAHVECRHISQKIERSSKISLVTLAGIVAGIFLGIGGAGSAAEAVTMGALAAGKSMSLAYSRSDEMQADQIGLRYLAKAGYDGSGLLKVLKKIRSKHWFGSDQIPTYLTTHPAPDDRIAYIDTWLETHGKTKSPTTATNPYDFKRARTRLTAMYGEESMVLRTLKANVAKHPEDPMAHYGYGLILARTGNRKDASIHLKIALEKNAFDPYILKDLGRIYFLDGRYAEAMAILEGVVSLESNDPEGLFFLGRTQMELGRHKAAASSFEKLLEKKPDYTRVLYFLGQVYGKQGRLGEAHYYLGIYYKNKGKFKNAIFHLKKALNNLSDADKKQKAKKMLKEIKKKSAEVLKNETKGPLRQTLGPAFQPFMSTAIKM